ncbi:MAG: pyridoxal-phosphate dependent enzyme [Gammaproteobacteria bacterium]|nr:pyridoxal-phosphate dependent enzyme [Gammaproteobacteria bacterium]
MIALFEAYPGLAGRLPYVGLGEFPTPVHSLERLGDAVGARKLFVKRDDVSALRYGGNKVRKLEFLLGRARQGGADHVLTLGAAGSNHALATAIYAGGLGLASTSVLYHQPNGRYVARNLLFAKRCGARLEVAASDRAAGRVRPHGSFNIPLGGSSILGTVGFVSAGLELAAQVLRGELPPPQRLYVALGTMGTAAGLALGLRAAGLETKIVAVRVVAERIANRARLARLYRNVNRLLSRLDPAFPPCPLAGIELRDEFYGEKYALFTPEGMRAVALAREHESLSLEGTYTGKAFAALLEDMKRPSLRDETILFWNTYNSRPFPHDLDEEDYRELPGELHRYFEEPVQPLDRVDAPFPAGP